MGPTAKQFVDNQSSITLESIWITAFYRHARLFVALRCQSDLPAVRLFLDDQQPIDGKVAGDNDFRRKNII